MDGEAGMPHQYAANDARTGLEVTVTGEFPDHPDDRVRIARTSNLFTRLMSTILATENETERRHRFRAVETQLEVAEALIRGDMAEVQRSIRSTLQQMGISDDQLREVEEQLREHLKQFGGDDLGPLEQLFEDDEARAPGLDDRPLDDQGLPDDRGPDTPQPDERWLPDDDDSPEDETPPGDRGPH